MKRLHKSTLLIALILLLISCREIRTEDPQKVFLHWTGLKPPPDVELRKANYWQSSHWSKEYILFMELIPSEKWWNEFIKLNELDLDTNRWNPPEQIPSWFKPSNESKRFCQKKQFYNDSRYYRDSLTGVCFIYEIQL